MNKSSFKCHQTIKISVVFTYPTFSFSCCQVSDDKQSSVGHEDLHFLLPIVHHFHCSLVSAKTIQNNISLNFVTEPKHSTFHFCSVQFNVKFKSLWHEVIWIEHQFVHWDPIVRRADNPIHQVKFSKKHTMLCARKRSIEWIQCTHHCNQINKRTL